MSDAPRLEAIHDTRLRARLVHTRELRYAHGADEQDDRPAHVRAGSGLAWVGDRLVVVQDDTNFLALVSPHDGRVTSVKLPAGKDGARQFDTARGNKKHKLDLEAVASIGPANACRVIAIGSGSKKQRESIVIAAGLEGEDPEISVHHAPALYRMLRDRTDFSGSELNIEGAMFVGDAGESEPVLRLFNRGNGARRDGRDPVNAWADFSWAALESHLRNPNHALPEPLRVVSCEIGHLHDCPLGFTDAVLWQYIESERRILVTAAAEASKDAVDDGTVHGSAIGVLVEREQERTLRWVPITHASGEAFTGKVEGIALARGSVLAHDAPEAVVHVHVVIDQDDHERPAQLGDVVLEGPWW